MKKCIWISFWMFVFVLARLEMAYAAFNSTPDLPVLVNEADVICVAKIISIKSLNRVKIEVVHKGVDGNPVTIDAQNAIADVVVENVLKGKVDQVSCQITFRQNVYVRGNSLPFTELVSGENEMLFLIPTNNKGVFALIEPASHGRSKISFGAASVPSLPHGLTPLRAVLLTLTKVTSGIGSSKPITVDCLQRLQTITYLLYVKPGIYSDADGVKNRLALEEPILTDQPTMSSLEQFVKAQLLSPIIKLTKSSDKDVSEQAFITAGHLQDAAVIPDLARIAVKNYVPGELGFAADTIGEYRNPDAVIPLIHILKSSSADVRQQASFSLGELHDPLALPFLIERLGDSSPHVVSTASEALFEITGQFGNQLPPGDAQSLQSREITFWKKWAAANQDKLKNLRLQVETASSVKSR